MPTLWLGEISKVIGKGDRHAEGMIKPTAKNLNSSILAGILFASPPIGAFRAP
jgi:hypothetical protein